MKYERSQMVYNDYKWTARSGYDDPNFRGVPDSTLLNRSEGYEVLYFINKFASDNNWNNSLASRQHLERILHDKLPGSIRSHANIRTWIAQNYQSI